jgi:CelD/BcsL family acetyltransferase involved in cellulose biosynthesis
MPVGERSEQATGVQVEVVRRREDLPRLRPAWERLAAADRRDGFFRGYAWNVLWLHHVAPDATPHVLTVSHKGELVGLAPLCETVHVDRYFRLPALAFAGRDIVTGDFLDVLAAPGHEDVVRDAFFAHLGDELPRWPLVVLGECLRGSLTARRADEWIAAGGRAARWQQERTCPYIELPADFDAYLATLTRNMRRSLKRHTRQLPELGCEIVRLRGASEVLPHLPVLFRLHAERWRERGQSGNFVRPGLPEFVGALVAEPEVSPELYLVRDAGVPLAALLTFRWGDAVLVYQCGWDPASPHARLSPLAILLGRAIADAIEDGCRWCELLQGDEAYKSRFTAQVRRTATLLVGGRGLRRRAYFAALRVHERWKAARSRPQAAAEEPEPDEE